MPPQIENQIPHTENPIQPETSHSHTQLIWLTVAMILVGILAVGYLSFSNWIPDDPNDSIQSLTVSTTTDQFFNAKVYRNEEYKFEFKSPDGIIIKDEIIEAECEALGKLDCKLDIANYDIKISYSTPEQNALSGITYCGVYAGNERCEILDLKNGSFAVINWEYSTASIEDKNGGTIGFTLKDTSKLSKFDFKEILSTFKFIPTSTSINTQDIKTGSGQFCNGQEYIKCPVGYSCKLKDKMIYSDGVCEIRPKEYSGGCVSVVVPAKNKITGEIYTFPDPCSMPDGWEMIK